MIKPLTNYPIGENGGYCEYSAGEAPKLENEVAFSQKIMDENHLEIGDTVMIRLGGKDQKLIITGYYSDYMQLGESARLNPAIDMSGEILTGHWKATVDMNTDLTQQEMAYHQIGEKAVQIENFVSEIIRASKQDIVRIEVEKGAFYLKDLVHWMEAVYGEKCALRRCAFTVGAYQNRIFQGDYNRLMEVFENLFENALKYGDGRRIQVSFYEEDYCQLIRVFNTGEPVSEKELVHLFDSFFRGENTRGQQGNGLGLYICREIMLKMNGEIFAACEPDGMAFVVVLPVYAGGQKD